MGQIVTGDFDGDGLTDKMALRFLSAKGKWQGRLEIFWGSGRPTNSLPIEAQSVAPKIWVNDVDKDGRWEIVTLCQDALKPKRWELTVLEFRPDRQRFSVVSRLTGKMSSLPPKPTRSHVAPVITGLSPPPIIVEPILFDADLNADGYKDFALVWEKRETFHGISAMLQTECIAVQVICWRGKSLQVRTFSPHELPFPTETENLVSLRLQILDKERIAVADEWFQKCHFAFRFLSLRPLGVQMGGVENKAAMHCHAIAERRCCFGFAPLGETGGVAWQCVACGRLGQRWATRIAFATMDYPQATVPFFYPLITHFCHSCPISRQR